MHNEFTSVIERDGDWFIGYCPESGGIEHLPCLGDTIYDELRGKKGDGMLVPIFRDGQLVYHSPALTEISAHRERDFARFPESMKRFESPERRRVTIE